MKTAKVRSWQFVLGLLLLVALAALAQLAATRWGVGLSPDSAQYIAGARSLARGDGFSFPNGDGQPIPITLWPPMFSTLLALPLFAGLDPVGVARWLNLALLIGLVVVSALAVNRLVGQFRYAALAAAALVLASPVVLQVHSWAWSEPTCLFTGFLGVLLLDRYLHGDRHRILAASAIAIAMSFVTRFQGAAFVVAGAVGILARVRWPAWKSALRELAVFGGITCLPAALWTTYTLRESGQAAGRDFTFGAITSSELSSLSHQLSLWFAPGRLSASTLGLTVSVATFSMLLLCAHGLRHYSMRGRASGSRDSLLFPMLASLAVGSVGIVVLGRLFVEPRFPLDDLRYWVVTYVALVLLLTAAAQFAFSRLFRALDGPRTRRIEAPRVALGLISAIAFAYFLSLQAYRAAPWIANSYRSGLGFNSVSWHRSELLGFVRTLPQDAVLYSNGFDVINVLTERYAFASPLDLHATPSRDESQYNADLADMRERLGAAGSYFIYFSGITWRRLATDEVLKQDLALAPVFTSSEGTAYQLAIDGN